MLGRLSSGFVRLGRPRRPRVWRDRAPPASPPSLLRLSRSSRFARPPEAPPSSPFHRTDPYRVRASRCPPSARLRRSGPASSRRPSRVGSRPRRGLRHPSAATTTSPLVPVSSSSPRSLRSDLLIPAATWPAVAPSAAPEAPPIARPAPIATAGKSATSAPTAIPIASPPTAPCRVGSSTFVTILTFPSGVLGDDGGVIRVDDVEIHVQLADGVVVRESILLERVLRRDEG